MGRIHHNANGSVTVIADNGVQATFTAAQWTGNEAARIASTGNGITAPVPEWISRAQFKLALKAVNQLDAVKAILANPSTSDEIKFAFDDEPIIRRDSPGLEGLRVLMNVTNNQLDNFFRNASKIIV